MSQLPLYNTPYEVALRDLQPRIKQGIFKVETREVQEGDYVRYPVGFSTHVQKVLKDENNDLYVEGEVNNCTYKQYIYKKKEGVKWDTRLATELGFFITDKPREQHEL